MKKLMSISFLIVFLFACGNGGGGGGTPSTPTPIGTVVNLSTMKDFSEGRIGMAFHITGSSSAGYNFTEDLSSVVSTPTSTLNVVNESITLTNTTTGAFFSVTAIAYYYPTGYGFKEILSDGTTFTLTSQSLLPLTAKIGDSGLGATGSYSNGNSLTLPWRLDPGTNGDAIFVQSGTLKNNINTVIENQELSYTIKPDGSISSLSEKIYFPSSGITVTLSGPRL